MYFAGNVRFVSCLGSLALISASSLVCAQTAAPDAAPEPAPAPATETLPAPKAPEDGFAMGIYFNPVSLLFGFYGLELDFSPQHLYSINVSGQYYSRSLLGIKTSAYGGDVGVQFFLTGKKPLHGAYIYPRVAFAKAKAEYLGTGAEASLIGLGVTAGYQWNWQPFSLRLGGGLIDYMGSVKATGDGTGGTPEISLRGLWPLIDLTLGFVF